MYNISFLRVKCIIFETRCKKFIIFISIKFVDLETILTFKQLNEITLIVQST